MELKLQNQAAISFAAKKQKKWWTLSTSRVREEGRFMGLEAWDK